MDFIFLSLDNKWRPEFEMNVTEGEVGADGWRGWCWGKGGRGGLRSVKMTCTVIMTQNKGSHPKHSSFFFFFFRVLSVIWLLQPKYSESLVVAWQTKMQFNCMSLSIYACDKIFFFFSHPPTTISSAASTAESPR